jgi:DNA polymerase/3'-5' exonuclease PolX
VFGEGYSKCSNAKWFTENNNCLNQKQLLKEIINNCIKNNKEQSNKSHSKIAATKITPQI